MPWSVLNYPDDLKGLSVDVRQKAIEIANELITEKTELSESQLISLAIQQARVWADSRKPSSRDKVKEVPSGIEIKYREDRYVIPYGEKEWAVKAEGKKKVEYVFRNKSEAVTVAKSEARKARASVTIQKRSGKVEKKISFRNIRKTGKLPAHEN